MKNNNVKYDLKEYVTINSDASYDHSTKQGGYGLWIKSNDFLIKRSLIFKSKITDSNEAEIKAVTNALHLLSKRNERYKVLVVNCDNAVVRGIINKGYVPDRFKVEGNILLKYLESYDKSYAKHIKGHGSKKKPRGWVNHWCDKQSRNYKKDK